MNRKPGLWATAIAVAVMVGLSLWAEPDLPDRVPMQWGLDGEVSRYGSRIEALVVVPLVAVGIGALFAVIPSIDPRRRHLEQSARAYNASWIVALLAIVAGHAASLLSALGRTVPVVALTPVIVGIVLLVVGNYLGKIRSNFFMGIRTPWTLSSERSWDRTHRLGGRLFAALGLLVLAVAPFSTALAFWVMGAGLVLVVLATGAYSYLVWRDDPARLGAEG